MHLVSETYQQLFDKTPNIMVIHAGLECGLFKNRIRTWTWSPSGRPSPERTPDEQVHIKSVGQYWQLLTAIFKSDP